MQLGVKKVPFFNDSFQYYPWTMLRKDSMGDVTSSTGIVFEMLDDIATNLNFSYSVISPPDNAFGVRKKGSNEYTGMMGQLISQDAFMAAAPFIVNLDKQMFVNFSTEFDMQPYSFLYSKRGTVPKFLIFVYPFTTLVNQWSSFLAVAWV